MYIHLSVAGREHAEFALAACVWSPATARRICYAILYYTILYYSRIYYAILYYIIR